MDCRKYLNPIKADKIRIGPRCDGGYVVAKKYLSPYLYSYGIGNTISFEENYNYLVPNCNLKLFDGTARHMNTIIKNNNWTHIEKNVYTANDLDIIESNVFVQMDIEGAELEIFHTMEKKTFQKIQQLCIEVHLGPDVKPTRAVHFFKKLNKYFYLVHIHGNNYSKNRKSFGLPIALELTYVNKLQWVDSIILEDKQCPVSGLDFPNTQTAPELILDWWVT